MSHVMLIHGLVNGEPTCFDGQYLKHMDFRGCEPGECNLITTLNPARAQQFDDTVAAWELWKSVDPRDPVRPDGKPNRPLTAFSVSIEPAPRRAASEAAQDARDQHR